MLRGDRPRPQEFVERVEECKLDCQPSSGYALPKHAGTKTKHIKRETINGMNEMYEMESVAL